MANVARAFTLLECLIVIGVVSILSAIGTSVGLSVIKRGKTESCQSNLRQLGYAITLYSADSDDKFPYARDCADILVPQTWPPNIAQKIQSSAALQVALADYTGNSQEVFRCPSDTGVFVLEHQFPTAVELSGGAFQKCGLSYEYHSDLGFSGVTRSAIRDQAGVVVLQDLGGHWHGSNSAIEAQDAMDVYGNKIAAYAYNVLYVDGHTKTAGYQEAAAAWRRG
jgi:prepilin-type N-terminal cleavage/methylation domain-containing protein/prepilin-type processing-associated H-X9-DG protein